MSEADLERAAEAERALALLPFHKALPPKRPRKKKAKNMDAFEMMGRMTAKAIKDATAPLEKRIAELEASPTKYVGVWTQGTEFAARSIVSQDGSMWHANETTKDKPGTSASWTLCVKRGRDGRDAPK